MADEPTELHVFRNRLRILNSIDLGELEAAGIEWKGDWVRFMDNPYRYLMRCDDPTAEAIWRAIVKRETR
jgi:hypothetical protein